MQDGLGEERVMARPDPAGQGMSRPGGARQRKIAERAARPGGAARTVGRWREGGPREASARRRRGGGSIGGPAGRAWAAVRGPGSAASPRRTGGRDPRDRAVTRCQSGVARPTRSSGCPAGHQARLSRWVPGCRRCRESVDGGHAVPRAWQRRTWAMATGACALLFQSPVFSYHPKNQ